VLFKLASLAALWPWLAIGAAVVAAGLAIQDFVYWLQGKGSLLGSWVGPFEDIQKAIEDMPFVKFFSGIRDIMQGNFGEGWEKIKDSLGSVNGAIQVILASIAAVGVAFAAWELLKFPSLILELGNVVNRILGIKPPVKAVEDSFKKMAGTATASAESAGKSLELIGAQTALRILPQIALMTKVYSDLQKFSEMKPEELKATQEANAGWLMNLPVMKQLGQAGTWMQEQYAKLGGPTYESLFGGKEAPAPGAPAAPLVPEIPAAQAVAAAPVNNVNTNLAQSNNITVNVTTADEIARQVQALMNQSSTQILDTVSRQISDSLPNTEKKAA
jgi:hypothetical protein